MQIPDIKHRRIALALLAALALPAVAQDKIWRCGNEYTNQPGDAKARGCKPVQGGNLTVIEGTKPQGARPAANPPTKAGSPGERVDGAEQRARDADAHAILEAELRKAETRLADLRLEYQGGEPDKRPEELRNPPRYDERVAELKARIGRAEADVAALKRELARTTPEKR